MPTQTNGFCIKYLNDKIMRLRHLIFYPVLEMCISFSFLAFNSESVAALKEVFRTFAEWVVNVHQNSEMTKRKREKKQMFLWSTHTHKVNFEASP